VRNYSTDEGRPLGTGLQEQVPNHLRRLCSKGKVVNAEGKGLDFTGSGDRQEEDRKGTTVEVSKRTLDDVQNRGRVTTAGSVPTIPAYGRNGVRHERWPELAMRQLNGTWEPEISMLTEKLQVEDPRGREYGCGVSGADCLVVVMKRGNARGAKGTGHSRHDLCGQLATGGTAWSLRSALSSL
jgi:hypothetical protein